MAQNQQEKQQTYRSIDTIQAYACCGKAMCCVPKGNRTYCELIWGGEFVKPRSQVTSYFFNPKATLFTRLFSCLYSTAVLAINLATDFEDGYWFAFLTNITYLGLWSYFTISTILSLKYVLAKDKSTFSRRADWFEVLVSWSYTSQFAFHLIVPGIYWAYQYQRNYIDYESRDTLGKATTISMHGLDCLFFLVEMVMNKIIFLWGHFFIFMATLAVYLAWTMNAPRIWPTDGPDGDGYAYAFLDPYNHEQLPYLILVIVACMAAWIFAYVVHDIRARIGYAYRKKNSVGTFGDSQVKQVGADAI